MRKKAIRFFACVLAFFHLTAFLVSGEMNLGNEDGTGFDGGTENNYWGVYTDGGIPLNDTEGLRVTVYDAETNSKVFNTIDITGNENISAATAMQYFSDGSELIPKTAWLSYVNGTYNSISESDMARFNNVVMSRANSGSGYKSLYIPQLASIDIVSTNNTANLEAIKNILSDREFLKALCVLIDGGLVYSDIEDGKYKIAFEPVAYFRYNGQNWAMSATECGLLNKYMKNHFSAGWNSTNNLRALLGPLTHSNLPRSAFLESRELGISAYAPTDSDYYNGNAEYNSDTCIIRCMGIGVLAGGGGETLELTGSYVAEYHTDTDVYTSFNFVNAGSDNIVASTAFSIYNANGELPATREDAAGEAYKVGEHLSEQKDDEGHIIGMNTWPIYGYLDESVEMKTKSAEDKIKVFVENPEFKETTFGTPPYTLLGTYRDGEFIEVGEGSSTVFSYSVRNSETGSELKSGKVSFSCPAGEEAMGWFEWHTPRTAQDIEITISSNNADVYFLDSNGSRYNTFVVSASIDKVEEVTPPDPTVNDKRPSWHNLYKESAVSKKAAQYASPDSPQTLEWYVWTYDWVQQELSERSSSFNVITSEPNGGSYVGASYYSYSFIAQRRGIDNTFYATAAATQKKGREYEGAVLLSGEARKMTFSVSIDAELVVTPSPRCYTASKSNSTGLYTMKSGYGIQVEVKTHISGSTALCTGSQSANVLFPEFNYRFGEAKYNRLLEKVGGVYMFKQNEYSTYNDRVHFTPIWYPDNNSYIVYAEVFDVWCPAGQLSARMTDWVYIKGNVYDDWHIAPVNQ